MEEKPIMVTFTAPDGRIYKLYLYPPITDVSFHGLFYALSNVLDQLKMTPRETVPPNQDIKEDLCARMMDKKQIRLVYNDEKSEKIWSFLKDQISNIV